MARDAIVVECGVRKEYTNIQAEYNQRQSCWVLGIDEGNITWLYSDECEMKVTENGQVLFDNINCEESK